MSAEKAALPAVHKLELPRRFYEDHEDRELPSGHAVSRSASSVIVEVTDDELKEIRADASHYDWMWTNGGMEKEYFGLCMSARATVRRIDTYLQAQAQDK